jgi:hypothetical protein
MSKFRTKFNPRQHGFITSKPTATYLLVYLELINLQFHPQGQVNAIYFDIFFSSAFDLLSERTLSSST